MTSNKKKIKITLNKTFILISLLIMVITSIITLISYSVNAQSTIDNNTKDIIEMKTTCLDTQNTIQENKGRISIIETHYEHIKVQLDRIEKKLEK